MYIKYCYAEIAQVQAVLDPDTASDGVSAIWNSKNATGVFVDDHDKIDRMTGLSFVLKDQAILFLAKDRDTMVRGFETAGSNTIACSYGTVVMGRGYYGISRKGSFKRAITQGLQKTTGLGSVVTFYKLNKGGAWKSGISLPSGTTHEMTKARLGDRGYFVAIAGRMAFKAPPQGNTITYVNDYKTTFKALASRIRMMRE